jgi:hypothetical protein
VRGHLSILHHLAAIVFSGGACVGADFVHLPQPTDVVLSIAIDRARFAPDAKLVAQIWNAAALAALEANATCVAAQNPATGATEMRCPPGVFYRQITPLELATPTASLVDRLDLAATGVRAGERFRVRVAGVSADRCNTTTGEQTSIAEAGTTRVNLVWETTLKACGQGGGV